jgi:hypothetical protein
VTVAPDDDQIDVAFLRLATDDVNRVSHLNRMFRLWRLELVTDQPQAERWNLPCSCSSLKPDSERRSPQSSSRTALRADFGALSYSCSLY